MSKISEGSKICIIGAGAVGATCAFAIAMKQLCSELVLIDVNQEKAHGEALDISHGLPFLGQMDIHAGGYEEVKGADIIVITAGIPRKPGETRIDLAKKNVNLAHKITDSIMEHYDGGVIMVVSNPCDVVTYMVTKWTGLPTSRVIGAGTNLDSARFRWLLASKLNVDVRNVHGYILGEHGETQFPAWSRTHVAGVPVEEYARSIGAPLSDEDKAELAERTKSAGAEIIKLPKLTQRYAVVDGSIVWYGDINFLSLLNNAALDSAYADSSDIFIIVDRRNQNLKRTFRITFRRGNMVKYGIKERFEVFSCGIRIE